MKSFGAKTLAFPAPVWVVGTFDQDERPNIMTAAWVGICCSSPPCVVSPCERPPILTATSLVGKHSP